MSVPSFHSLQIRDYSLQVHLGCSEQEQSILQEVRLSVELRFAKAPSGVFSDDLQGTICYGQLCQAMLDYVKARRFQLIEKMAGDLLQVLRQQIQSQLAQWPAEKTDSNQNPATGSVAIAISVYKVVPPVPGLLGGAIYRIGDFL
ncbi:MAG: dihydroneopterin aldolase [Pseudobdellovibrionaceae bacterium]